MIWYLNDSCDIAVSTRVRLARNLSGVPFPNKLKERKAYIQKIKDSVFLSNSTLSSDFVDTDIENASDIDKLSLVERHLISRQMMNGGDKGCLINKDNTMSIMIMEEDHIREQVILGGYKPDEAFEICNKVDDVLSENLNFAFDEKFGYLTSCPTNTGTGLRISVMLHLPCLALTGRIKKIATSASNVGITVRGYNGEGTEADGYFYQISNQITMGASEHEILDRVKNVTEQIIGYEKETRKNISGSDMEKLSDRIMRSYGILKHARIMTSKEAISRLSDVLLGKNMGIIKEKINRPVMEMIVRTGPANIGVDGESPEERDLKRAAFIRENL